MKKRNGFIDIALAVVIGAVVVGSLIGGAFLTSRERKNQETKLKEEIASLREQVEVQSVTLGAVDYVASKPTRLGGSGVASTDTTINLVDLETPAGDAVTMTDFGDTGYGTLEPNGTNKEFISFTGITQNADGTAQLTGVTRGLNFVSPYTASTTLRRAHPGGSRFAIPNSPQLYDTSISKFNTSFVTGTVTFASSSVPRLSGTRAYSSGDELLLVTYGQLASTSFSGTVDASLTQKGITEIATNAELLTGATSGDTTAPMVARSNSFNATSSATTTVPVASYLEQSLYKISPTYIATSTPYNWSSQHTFSGGVTTTAPFTASSTVALNGTTTLGANVINSFTYIGGSQLVNSTTTNVAVSNASGTVQTLYSFTLPTSTLVSNNVLNIRVFINALQENSGSGASQNNRWALRIGSTDVATTTVSRVPSNQTGQGYLDISVSAIGTSTQETNMLLTLPTNNATSSYVAVASTDNSSSINMAQTNTIRVGFLTNNNDVTMTVVKAEARVSSPMN